MTLRPTAFISNQREHIEYNLLAQLTLPEKERDFLQIKYLMNELFLQMSQELLDTLNSRLNLAKLESSSFYFVEIAKLIETLANLSKEQGFHVLAEHGFKLQKQAKAFTEIPWSLSEYESCVNEINGLIQHFHIQATQLD
ncbi:MAG: hypothetical protein QM520_04200 [Gammaproteobacteria bacterium]|nr:hypothetical protein [Gammaproteobacteria bacterium]